MGFPCVITTDQGKEFHNKFNSEMTRTFGIQHCLTTPYHPQANGLDERFNQTLVNTLAKFAQENQANWDQNLQEVVYVYNTAIQESTRHSPFEVMFGRQGRLPVDINMNSQLPEDILEDLAMEETQSFTQLQVKWQDEAIVKSNVAKAQVCCICVVVCISVIILTVGKAKSLL